ncbi:MAG: right-handed parallel beta-helix repeat-containing protein [Oscillospiraceae bacterium]|nr:right-handed parallel beta-helix repeat-containing protein [Oscillospiraceae bacterium]
MKQRKIITWLLVLTMALSLFSAAAFADEPEEGDSPAAGEAAGETLETEEAEEAEGEEPEAEEEEAEEAEEPAEPAESEEPTEPEEEAVSEEPALLLGSAANEGILLASDDNTANVAYIGDKEYTTLEAAVEDANAATEAVTIKLNDDVVVTSGQLITNKIAEITLDLNGHSITRSASTGYVLQVSNENATLTVTDSSTGGDGVISGTSGTGGIWNIGTLNIEGGTISATGGTSGAVYAINSRGGTVSVSGGTISATGGSTSYGIYLSDNTEVKVTDGSISGGSYGIACTSSSLTHTLTVSGGSITSNQSYGILLQNGKITITGGEITSTSSRGVELEGGTFSMSGGSVSGTYGVSLYSWTSDINAEITGGTIIGSSQFGVYAQGDTSTSYVVNLTIDDTNAEPVISGTRAGLWVSNGAVVTVNGGTISGGHGIYVVGSYITATKLIVDGEVTVSATNATGQAVYGMNKDDGTEQNTNTNDMKITISNGTYSTQVASDFLADDVTQITYDGTGLYYIDTPANQASRIEALIADAEQDPAVNTVEITVTDGDLELTGISTASTDVHINSTSSGTVIVNGTALTAGSEVISIHVLTHYEAKDAACTEDGNEEYWYCSVCGKYFSDADGTTEITDPSSLTLSASGHSYGDPVFTWAEDYSTATAAFTCDEGDGTVTENCTVTSKTTTAATCTTAGEIVYTASVTFEGQTYTETQTVAVPAAGHDWETEYTVDKAATCTTEGSQSIHCKNCDEVKDSQVIPATGHSYGEAVFTWSEDGKSAVVGFTCETCGDIQSVIATITSEVKTAATETEAGVTVYTATVTFNGVEYTATKELADIPATGTSAGTTPTASPANKAPTTGDESSPILWALLLTVCAAALCGALTLSRKGKEK